MKVQVIENTPPHRNLTYSEILLEEGWYIPVNHSQYRLCVLRTTSGVNTVVLVAEQRVKRVDTQIEVDWCLLVLSPDHEWPSHKEFEKDLNFAIKL